MHPAGTKLPLGSITLQRAGQKSNPSSVSTKHAPKHTSNGIDADADEMLEHIMVQHSSSTPGEDKPMKKQIYVAK